MPRVPQIMQAAAMLALALGACSGIALAQPGCLVLDPELQGGYTGGCANGKAEGQGTAKGNATYTGGFLGGKKHGRGVKVWPWGDRYDGEFVNDAKDGWGVYTWGARSAFAGDRYEGRFSNDKRNGYGIYVWASGDSYAGPWKDDAVTGWVTPMMIARFRATNAYLEAMAPGVKLCSESTVGAGSRAWTEAETQAVDKAGRRVSVKVTGLSPAPLMVAGTQVAVGDVIWDDPLNWIPCN